VRAVEHLVALACRHIQTGDTNGIVLIGLSIQLAPRPLHLIVNCLIYTLMSMLALSLVMAVAVPSIGIDYELGGAWRGALSQKMN
jgi:hypothetical protein